MNQEAIDNLNAAYHFPCVYTFKLIGKNTKQFKQDALDILQQYLPGRKIKEFERKSKKQNHISISFEIMVDNADTILLLYEKFRLIDDLHMLL